MDTSSQASSDDGRMRHENEEQTVSATRADAFSDSEAFGVAAAKDAATLTDGPAQGVNDNMSIDYSRRSNNDDTDMHVVEPPDFSKLREVLPEDPANKFIPPDLPESDDDSVDITDNAEDK